MDGAVTGRISTEDPSVMNITERGGIKRLYLPRPGHLILDGDNKGMELRCYSVIAGDTQLRDQLVDSRYDKERDPHTIINKAANILCGREISRTMTKAGVFGRIYGRGRVSFERAFRISSESAQEFTDAIDSLVPTIDPYRAQIISEIHAQGYLESYFHRRRRFPLITNQNKREIYREGQNFKVQSMASDINLFGMLHLWNNKERLGAFPLFPVHDSIVFDIESVDCVPLIKKEWEEYSSSMVNDYIDFVVEFKAGPSWGEMEKVEV